LSFWLSSLLVRDQSGIFLIFSLYYFVLKKDSRQAGMTDYEEKKLKGHKNLGAGLDY
jgi:hypothetical protein